MTDAEISVAKSRPRPNVYAYLAPSHLSLVQASASSLYTLLLVFGGRELLKIGSEAVKAFEKKTGEAIGNALGEWFKKRFSGKSSVETEITLFGPDGEPLKRLRGRR